MNEILSKIQSADSDELNDIVLAVTARYMELFPGWEIAFLSLPRNDPEACIRKLEEIAAFIRSHHPSAQKD